MIEPEHLAARLHDTRVGRSAMLGALAGCLTVTAVATAAATASGMDPPSAVGFSFFIGVFGGGGFGLMTAGAIAADRSSKDQHRKAGHMSDPPAARAMSDRALATLVRNLADAVVVADADGTITFWNRAATDLFGWSAEEALGQSLDLIIPARYRARHWEGYRTSMASGTTRYGGRLLEVPALRRSGEPLSIAFTVTLMLEPSSGRTDAIAAVIRDDTEHWQERRRQLDAAPHGSLSELRGAGSPTAQLVR